MTHLALPSASSSRIAQSSRQEDAGVSRLKWKQICRSCYPDVTVFLGYLGLALVGYLHVWLGGAGDTVPRILPVPGDVTQEVWFLAVVAHRIQLGKLPFYTASVNSPTGANLLAGTSMPLLGLLSLPFQRSLGPVTSYNILITLALPLSAFSAYLCFSRWVPSRTARALGGLVFAFSPSLVGEGTGHLFLSFMILPPLLVLLTDELLIRQCWRSWFTGAVLGLVLSLEYFISQEVFATSLLLIALAVVLLSLIWPRKIPGKAPYAIRGLLVCVVALLCTVGYPIWYQLAGPLSLGGPAQAPSLLSSFHSDLFSAFIPTRMEQFGPRALKVLGTKLTNNNMAEVGTYLGPFLAILLMWITARAHDDSVIRMSGSLSLAIYILSMGPRLQILGHETPVLLPEDILLHVPLYDQIVPGRLGIYMWLFIGLLLARWLGEVPRVWSEAEMIVIGAGGSIHVSMARSSRLITVLRYAVCLIALSALVPAWPYPTRRLDVPSFFMTRKVSVIPVHANVLTYPWVDQRSPSALVWQAVAGFDFRVPGGYVNLPRGDDRANRSVVARILNGILAGEQTPVSRIARCEFRRALYQWKITDAVVSLSAPHAGHAVVVLSNILGRSAPRIGGVVLWRLKRGTGRWSSCRG